MLKINESTPVYTISLAFSIPYSKFSNSNFDRREKEQCPIVLRHLLLRSLA